MKRVILCFLMIIFCGKLFSQEVAFTIPEKDLIPEGITYDLEEKSFYLSSIYKNKIIKVSKTKVSDFITSNQHGFVGGVGLHVDNKSRILWACSGNVMGTKFRTGVFAFDLNTKKLLKKIYYPTDTIQRLFNDLVIANDGSVYITNTYDKSIWKWSILMEEPLKLPLTGKMGYTNGITISPDNEILFVATSEGLVNIKLEDSSVELIQMPEEQINSKRLDGIGFYKNSIVGVQNSRDSSSSKVVRYYLAENYSEIKKVEVIDVNNKYFAKPTTLTIVDDKLYVIANSQLNNLDQKNIKIINLEKLTETVILKYELE